MPSGSPGRAQSQVEAFGHKHRTGLVTLLFTDMVDSTAIKQQLGDHAGASFFDRHHQLVRQTLEAFPSGQEIETAGDSFLIIFSTPSDAVQFALVLQVRLRELSQECAVTAGDRIGIHVGEVVIKGDEANSRPKDLYGIQIDTCSRVMSLAKAGQVLMTRAVFDSARQVLKGEDIQGVGALEWLNHGPYLLKGLEESVEICEVREVGQVTGGPPTSSEKAQRQVRTDEEPVLGWRPAVGQIVPNTRWLLEKKLGEGGFGEVWLGRNTTTKERRVFKFCFQAERVRFLKRELTLFRLLKERVGDHINIVAIRDVNLDKPPFYVEMDYVEGADLRNWCEAHGGAQAIPLDTRLEIVAQAADGLQAAHDAGIIHRDIKPANILIAQQRNPELKANSDVRKSALEVKLTDFGIGQVVSEEYLQGITRAGFTQTMLGDSSSRTGTQLYMAPELLAGKPASIRSDIYSLGVVLYQLLVGDLSRPVTTDWTAEIQDQLLRGDLQHCFAGKPEERFAGAGLLARNLRQLSERRAEVTRQLEEQAARERAAYRRGILRTASLAAVILLVVTILAVVALRQSYKARDAAARASAGEQRARRNLYAADMLLAAQALQANNRGRAVQLLQRNRPQAGIDSRGWEWRYLWTLCRGDALSLTPAHNDRVVDVAFSPNGEFLFSASHDSTIKVWDVATRSHRRTLPHPVPLDSMALSPDGQYLLAGALSGPLFRWSTRTWTNEPVTLSVGPIRDLLFSPSGDRLALRRAADLEIVRWNDFQVLATLPSARTARNAQSMAFSASGDLLAYPAPEGKIALVSLRSNSTVRFLPGTMDDINSIAFSPDDRFLAAADWSPRIAIWDLASNTEVKSLTNHAAWVSSVAFLRDGSGLLSASADQTVKYWDTRGWQEVATLQGHLDEVQCLAVSPRGDVLATGGKDGALNLWSTKPPRKEKTRLEFKAGGSFLSLDGRTLLLVNDRIVSRWDALALEPKATNRLRDGDRVLALGVGRLAVRRGGEGIEILDSMTLNPLTELQKAPAPWRLKFSTDDALLAVVSSEQDLSLWDGRDGRPVADLGRLPFAAASLEFSPDKSRLAVGLVNGNVQVRSLNSPVLPRVLTGQRESVSLVGMAFSPDSRFLATGNPDASLRLWNLADGSFVPLPRALMAYFSVAYSPDGTRIAAAGPDSAARVIDTMTGEEVASLDRHTRYRDFAREVRFSADGNALLVLTDTSLYVWRAASLAEIQGEETLQATRP